MRSVVFSTHAKPNVYVRPGCSRRGGHEPSRGSVLPHRRRGGVCCDEKGGAAFQLLRHRRNEPRAFLYVFDLPELNGTGLRREPIEVRKATLASILRKSRHGVRPNEHLEHGCGLTVFQHARKMGLEGCRATWPPSGYPCPSQSCFRTLRSVRACLQNRRNPDWSGNAVSCP
jgi:hypothetical protein